MWTICANWHQNRFIHFQNIVFTSLVTDERTNERVENIMPPPANLTWQMHQRFQEFSEACGVRFGTDVWR